MRHRRRVGPAHQGTESGLTDFGVVVAHRLHHCGQRRGAGGVAQQTQQSGPGRRLLRLAERGEEHFRRSRLVLGASADGPAGLFARRSKLGVPRGDDRGSERRQLRALAHDTQRLGGLGRHPGVRPAHQSHQRGQGRGRVATGQHAQHRRPVGRVGRLDQPNQRLIHARFAEAVQSLVRGFRHRPLPGARQPHQHGHIGRFAVLAQAINCRRPDGRVGPLFDQAQHGRPRSHVRQVRQHSQQDQLTGGLHGRKRSGHCALQGHIRGRRVGGHGGFTHGGVFALHHLGHQFDRLGLRQRADQSFQGRDPDELRLGGLHQVAVDGDGLGIRAGIPRDARQR